MSWRESVESVGFATIHEVVPRREVEELTDRLSLSYLRRSRAGVRHALRNGPVAALAREPQLLALAQGLLGPTALPFRATLFEKSLAANWLVVWHQDRALPIREKKEVPGWGPWSVKDGVTYAHAPASALSQVLALRVHLDDSTPENGPLRVLPGSHLMGVLEDSAIELLASRISPVECTAAKGGVVAMKPLLVHSSSKSRNEAPRRVLHIEYASSLEIADGLELQVA